MTDRKPNDRNALNWHSTTILAIRKKGQVVVAGDGQVSMGATILKSNARKVRRLGKDDKIIAGLRAQPPTLSRFLKDWKPSWKRTRGN